MIGNLHILASLGVTACMALAAFPASAVEYEISNERGGNTATISHPGHDYAPTIMKDGPYRMWWCGSSAGDAIFYSEAASMSGPWTTPQIVFEPTRGTTKFDSKHTCDPSVVRVYNTYYMYYGGYANPPPGVERAPTRIGVASSPDGIHWSRLNAGNPIVVPVRDVNTVPTTYGAGQPSVIHLDGYFYLTYTDSTGWAGDANGAGQYVLRSVDPTFQSQVEELTSSGFAPRTSANHTRYSRVNAVSVDWQYSDVLQSFIYAIDGTGGKMTLRMFNKQLSAEIGPAIMVDAMWVEGPGIASRPDKHSIPSATCGVVPVDMMRALGDHIFPSTWNLGHRGFDVVTSLTCASSHMPEALQGYTMNSTGLPSALVTGGHRLQFQVGATLKNFSRNKISVDSNMYHLIPYAGALSSGQTVLQTSGSPGAFLIGNSLWPVGCLKAVTDNNSTITQVSASTWNSYELGPSLHCLL